MRFSKQTGLFTLVFIGIVSIGCSKNLLDQNSDSSVDMNEEIGQQLGDTVAAIDEGAGGTSGVYAQEQGR